jgi:3-oxoacyl-[acyl-carrier protein] reductase
MELGLRDRVCVVTGASRGIGAATALMLCAEGAWVLLIGRDEAQLEGAVESAREAGGRAEGMVLDVTAADAGEKIVLACGGRFGSPIAALVNNAGTSWTATPDELTDADWRRLWELHVMAPMRLMRSAAPAMAEAGWGRVVNVCSSSGKRPSLNNMAYSVTKAAQLSLSRAFADAWAARGVLVNAVAPGIVGSELWTQEGGLADQIAEQRGVSREEVLEERAKSVPLGRFGKPEEIAAVITFLCSERASDVVGAAWSVDGGAVPVII